MEESIFEQRTDLSNFQQSVQTLKEEIGKVIVGQEQMIELLLAAMLADGHVLIEGVPGVAKTLTAKLLSKSISVGFSNPASATAFNNCLLRLKISNEVFAGTLHYFYGK